MAELGKAVSGIIKLANNYCFDASIQGEFSNFESHLDLCCSIEPGLSEVKEGMLQCPVGNIDPTRFPVRARKYKEWERLNRILFIVISVLVNKDLGAKDIVALSRNDGREKRHDKNESDA